MADADHPRFHLRRFLSLDVCKELEFIHRSCGTVGYRPGVFSTTLSHLIATDCSHLILPFLPIRERLKEKVEEFFGCEYEVVIEFTGLVSWCKGASIGWHSDDNRPYLKQRDFTAVCYLNNHGTDFQGGVFHFQDGQPTSIFAVAGDALIYTADSRNVHSVDEVVDGERLTLTLWFSRDSSHNEDTKLISRLSEKFSKHKCNDIDFRFPSSASSNMYWFSENQSGFDIRWGRVHTLGYNFCTSGAEVLHPSSDSLESLDQAVQLSRGCHMYARKFANRMHALQVVQFYYWKAAELNEASRMFTSDMSMMPLLLEKTTLMDQAVSCDFQLAEAVFSSTCPDDAKSSFDWVEFSLAITEWENYARRMHERLLAGIAVLINVKVERGLLASQMAVELLLMKLSSGSGSRNQLTLGEENIQACNRC